MKERHIFCRPDRLAFNAISQIATKYSAQVFPHLRIKEVANRDWINAEYFDYALKGHIDFTVAVNFRPVLAIELDGRFHQTQNARERDAHKDEVCDALDIPLVRIDYGYMRAELLETVLMDLVQSWLEPSDRAVARQHEFIITGTASPDEPLSRTIEPILPLKITSSDELQIHTTELPGRYFESTLTIRVEGVDHTVGKGRARTPLRSRVCGCSLAEQIALAQASTSIYTPKHSSANSQSKSKLVVRSGCLQSPLESKCITGNSITQKSSAARTDRLRSTASQSDSAAISRLNTPPVSYTPN